LNILCIQLLQLAWKLSNLKYMADFDNVSPNSASLEHQAIGDGSSVELDTPILVSADGTLQTSNTTDQSSYLSPHTGEGSNAFQTDPQNISSQQFIQQQSDPLSPSVSVHLDPNTPGPVSPNYFIPDVSVHLSPNAPISHAASTFIQEKMPSRKSVAGLVKLMILIFLPLGGVALTTGLIFNQVREKQYVKEKEVLLSVPMKNVNWQDLGNVFEPVIELPVKTLSNYEDWEFLIDSGAVISSLPNEWAEKTGQELAFLKRSTFRGFGGKTSLAYQGQMEVQIGEESVIFPVVFTESSGTKSLLGRKGFFEDYSVYFNHKEKIIEIRN